MQVYRTRVITPSTASETTYMDDAIVAVDEDGVIDRVAPYDNQPVDADLRPHVLSPGFIDAHIHFPQTKIIGQGAGTLLPWLHQVVFPEEARFDDDTYARQVADDFCTALASSGTTTAMIYGSSHHLATDVLMETLDQRGLRAITGPVLMDTDCPPSLQVDASSALDSVAALAGRWHGHDNGRLQVAVVPRFALSCTPEMLKGAGEIARDLDLPITTHLSENTDECAAVLERFGVSDYLKVYEDAGLVGSRSVFAHCIHLSDDEWDRFADAGAVVAHCPDSNFFLSSGNMPVDTIRNRSIPIVVGTDVAAGRTFSIPGILREARKNAHMVEADVPLSELFWWATRGGATGLGLSKVGMLAPTLDADMVLLDIPEEIKDADGVVEYLLTKGKHLDIQRTWVRGKEIWRRDA